MPRDDDRGERPKRSWSEIDKMRDGKRRGSQPDFAREKLERSATYSRYKSAADKFFSGEILPESLQEKLDPTGEAKARREALAKLKGADGAAEFAAAAKEYVEAWGAPEDPYLLDRMVGHPDEGIVLKALEKLIALAEAGELKAPKSLPERLRSAELNADDPDVQDEAKRLATMLRKMGR